MEIGVSKSGQLQWNSTPQEQDLRSYRCSFCKRGFSNAQALGGHMNIHRKDRAKLKQFEHDSSGINANEDVFRDQLQLTLSVKSPSSSSSSSAQNRKEQSHSGSSSIMFGKRNMKVLNHGALPELDLELRLGPEPDHV